MYTGERHFLAYTRMHYAYSGSSSQPDAVDGAKVVCPGCHLEVNSLCVLVALDFIQYTIGFEKTFSGLY